MMRAVSPKMRTPSSAPSIKRNAAANYAAQAYVTVIGIVMAPVYLSQMGTEAYGLIGFFTMMTAWFQLLDVGLTPTLVRETARFRGGAISADTLRSFLRALEVIFGGASIAGAVLMVAFANVIATRWLKVHALPLSEVANAVMLMGLAVPLRWVSGLYRGVVNGFERQIWLGGYNASIATFRFVGVLVVFKTLGTSPAYFFAYQLCVAAVELCGLAAMTYRLTHRGSAPREAFSWKPLMGNLTFSLTIAFTATAWVVVTQTDKLVLSKILPLAGYGVFSLAVVAAGAINSVGGPLGQALLPRLTKLAAQNDEEGVHRLYSIATQAICLMVVPAVVLLCFFTGPLLRAWTGRPEIVAGAAPILRLYAIGNGFVALCGLAYFLQYAKGNLRLHFIGNALSSVMMIPLIIIAAQHYGGVGTGAVWATINGLYALGWIPVVHTKFYKGQHWKWLAHDVMPVTIPAVLMGWLAWAFVQVPSGRWPAFAVIAAVGIVLVAVSGCGSSMIRSHVARLVAIWIGNFSQERT